MSSFQSLDRAIDILFVFTKAEPRLTADEIARKAVLPRGSIYRYINALMENGLLERDPDTSKFQLGYKLLYFQSVIHYNEALEDIVHPFMVDINKKTSETVQLTMYRDGKAVPLQSVESNAHVRVAPPIGLVRDLHAGANDKVILAFRPQDEIDRIISGKLEKYTEYSITDPVMLNTELEKIRRDGFAYSSQEMHQGAWGVAAPIFDGKGNAVASIGISGPIFRLDDKLLELSTRLVIEAGKKLSDRLQFLRTTA